MGWQMDSALFLPPLSQRMVCTHWKGEGCRRADGYPQLPVSAQMVAPTPISMLYSGYGEPPHAMGFRLESQMFTVLPPLDTLVKFLS